MDATVMLSSPPLPVVVGVMCDVWHDSIECRLVSPPPFECLVVLSFLSFLFLLNADAIHSVPRRPCRVLRYILFCYVFPRMCRPVLHLHSGRTEWIGPMAQQFMEV